MTLSRIFSIQLFALGIKKHAPRDICISGRNRRYRYYIYEHNLLNIFNYPAIKSLPYNEQHELIIYLYLYTYIPIIAVRDKEEYFSVLLLSLSAGKKMLNVY